MPQATQATSAVYEMADDEVLISRSDLQGRITYANHTFVEVSGYSLNEIMGEPHSLFRHPSMPKAVFQNLWETIEAGKTWQGLIKNRRQNGEGYWMHTTIAPLLDGDRVVGYTSIRRKAAAKAIAQAERVYAAMQAGKRVALSSIMVQYVLRACADGSSGSVSAVCRPNSWEWCWLLLSYWCSRGQRGSMV